MSKYRSAKRLAKDMAGNRATERDGVWMVPDDCFDEGYLCAMVDAKRIDPRMELDYGQAKAAKGEYYTYITLTPKGE